MGYGLSHMTKTWTNEYCFHHKDLRPSGAVTLRLLPLGWWTVTRGPQETAEQAFRSPASDLLYEACIIDQATLRVYDATRNNIVLRLLMLYAFISPLF